MKRRFYTPDDIELDIEQARDSNGTKAALRAIAKLLYNQAAREQERSQK